MFISSPSKSALYGDVTERFNWNVLVFTILTRCAIILILCSVGCRLNKTMSPSFIERSTMYPIFRKVGSLTFLLPSVFIMSPLSVIIFFIVFPSLKSFFHLSIFK